MQSFWIVPAFLCNGSHFSRCLRAPFSTCVDGRLMCFILECPCEDWISLQAGSAWRGTAVPRPPGSRALAPVSGDTAHVSLPEGPPIPPLGFVRLFMAAHKQRTCCGPPLSKRGLVKSRLLADRGNRPCLAGRTRSTIIRGAVNIPSAHFLLYTPLEFIFRRRSAGLLLSCNFFSFRNDGQSRGAFALPYSAGCAPPG